ncbi:EF-hand domain-containing protein [Rhodoplanes sp. TEM]|uniref:EF-hand domain-containing protein n=1 Tax=Rhodoplanes tepidamans TaxID=200616 RepID=A0ABT5JI22_RHOTP|nr:MULTISPECIES: EF-hand domain-containing protein [Rhodoplanes]MDC7789360.1 EF-hand domain-containing protein [Rhodoplanes tepidamans]MDC7987735.1 EF-hand domain-containing protein [Rhodoplanes sp. TEM]MDQ0358481.1 Ca2+-binding EF-hand superfamily protein [Rhodoplanes tepidamans]
MSSARISSAGVADTETLLNLLQRKSGIRSELQRPAGSSEHAPGFAPAAGAAGDVNGPGGAGKYSISSETMAFLLTVQQTAVEKAPAAPAGSAGGPANGAGPESRVDLIFRAMDTDNDGRIGRAEFVSFIQARGGAASFAEQMFDKIDAADQGFITRDRMAAAMRQASAEPADAAAAATAADDRRPPFSVSA